MPPISEPSPERGNKSGRYCVKKHTLSFFRHGSLRIPCLIYTIISFLFHFETPASISGIWFRSIGTLFPLYWNCGSRSIGTLFPLYWNFGSTLLKLFFRSMGTFLPEYPESVSEAYRIPERKSAHFPVVSPHRLTK